MRKGRVFKSKLSDCCNLLSVLDTALEVKVLANKVESKCLKPLIAVIRLVRDRYTVTTTRAHGVLKTLEMVVHDTSSAF